MLTEVPRILISPLTTFGIGFVGANDHRLQPKGRGLFFIPGAVEIIGTCRTTGFKHCREGLRRGVKAAGIKVEVLISASVAAIKRGRLFEVTKSGIRKNAPRAPWANLHNSVF